MTAKHDLTSEVIRALDGRPFGKREFKAVSLCNAAPALLAACEELLACLHDLDETRRAQAVGAAHRAIAAAKGESGGL
jgi:hypothetical protein